MTATLFRSLAYGALLMFLFAGLVHAQANPGRLSDPQAPPEDASRVRMEKDMAKKANQQRQAELKHDTERLLTLATELKITSIKPTKTFFPLKW